MGLRGLLFPCVTLPAVLLLACLGVGILARLVAGFVAVLNPVSLFCEVVWVRRVHLRLAVSRLLVLYTFSLSIPGFMARLVAGFMAGLVV